MQMIAFRHELPEANRQLLRLLGYEAVVDPGAAECERIVVEYGNVAGHHDPRGCPLCRKVAA